MQAQDVLDTCIPRSYYGEGSVPWFRLAALLRGEDSQMRATVPEGVRDWRGKATVCPVHGESLLEDTIRVAYGLVVDYSHPERESLFPYSNKVFYAGCCVEPPSWMNL